MSNLLDTVALTLICIMYYCINIILSGNIMDCLICRYEVDYGSACCRNGTGNYNFVCILRIKLGNNVLAIVIVRSWRMMWRMCATDV